MASSLQEGAVGADGRTLSKPSKGPLNTLPTNDTYDAEDTLNGRKRGTTINNSANPTGLLDRRFNAHPSLPQLKIPTGASIPPKHQSPHTQTAPNTLSVQAIDDRPSAPITIPSRQSQPSEPTTPLTGRVPSVKFLSFPKQSHASPTHSRSNTNGFTPSPDSQPYSPRSESSQSVHSPITRRMMRPDRAEPSAMYTPSPLSPTMSAHSTSPSTLHNARLQPHHQKGRSRPAPMAIPDLPPFHPANYESRTSSSRIPSHPGSAAHDRQTSDTQRKIQRYQRDIVLSATRTGILNTGKSPLARPSSPRLNPLGSPGPVTPLMLEGQDDYFLAGPGTASRSALKESERRDMADRLIAAERDRLSHPERFERHSPAVSPAGGHG
ncbi:MAG: hypothetical protein Q9216_001408 [Gyalolechia sp. 2 TL-2023]